MQDAACSHALAGGESLRRADMPRLTDEAVAATGPDITDQLAVSLCYLTSCSSSIHPHSVRSGWRDSRGQVAGLAADQPRSEFRLRQRPQLRGRRRGKVQLRLRLACCRACRHELAALEE